MSQAYHPCHLNKRHQLPLILVLFIQLLRLNLFTLMLGDRHMFCLMRAINTMLYSLIYHKILLVLSHISNHKLVKIFSNYMSSLKSNSVDPLKIYTLAIAVNITGFKPYLQTHGIGHLQHLPTFHNLRAFLNSNIATLLRSVKPYNMPTKILDCCISNCGLSYQPPSHHKRPQTTFHSPLWDITQLPKATDLWLFMFSLA